MNPKPSEKLSLGAGSYVTIAWMGFPHVQSVLLSSIADYDLRSCYLVREIDSQGSIFNKLIEADLEPRLNKVAYFFMFLNWNQLWNLKASGWFYSNELSVDCSWRCFLWRSTLLLILLCGKQTLSCFSYLKTVTSCIRSNVS